MRRNLLISATALLLGLAAGLLWMREPTQPLTPQALSAARQRWNETGPRSYKVRYRMNRDHYEVTVHDGIVIEAEVNGQRPRAATHGNYSMDGLFELLAAELENISDPAGPYGQRAGAVMARVRFNESTGGLERYLRNSAGSGRGAEIEVLEFVALSEGSLSESTGASPP